MTNGASPASTGRPRLDLAGDAAARPSGLERALTRGGFQVSESSAARPPLLPPDAILITLPDAQDSRLRGLLESESGCPPRIVLFATHDPEAPVSALALGADDALVAPVHLPELCARLQARIRDRQAPRRTPYETEIRETLQDLVAEARTMLQPDEIVVALVRRLSRAFSLAQCSFVVTTPGDAEGRVLADVEPCGTESTRVELSAHPEIEEAIRTRKPVTISSSGGQNRQASTVIPVLRHDTVPAVLLLRGRDAQPALSSAQLEMASSLAHVAAQAIDGGVASRLPERSETLQGGGLDRRLQEEFERARRYSLSFSLVLLDVQPAAGRNGDAPRESGERLRREVGARLRRELRLPDFLARYGEDEFAIVLPETDLEGAVRSVTRVQERVAILPLEGGGRPQLSAGVVSYPHPAVTEADDLFALVEAALMRGKLQAGGRIGRAD